MSGWVPAWDARTVVLLGGAVLLAGLFVGLLNAAYIRWTAAQLGLGSWESYPAD